MFNLDQALAWLTVGELRGDGAINVARVCTDTRAVTAGDLFVAIRGERFDANTMAPQAEAAGAAAVVIERAVDGQSGPALVVPDSRLALGQLARGWRGTFDLPVIAVTGSNGKTTVKEMIAAILAEAFGEDRRLSTAGNLNNDIGVPLTVFGLNARHQAAVIELGMNRPGEIAWLTEIACPTVAMVNNAQREHQEFMASIEATAYENGAALAGLPADGVAVYPGDDEFTPVWRKLAGPRRVMEFGLVAADADADATAAAAAAAGSTAVGGLSVWAPADAMPESIPMHIAGQVLTVRLAISGRHNVRNALAAATCCLAIGVAPTVIVAGLQAFLPVKGRLVRSTLANGATLIDDSYNANPDSVRAAVDVLTSLTGSSAARGVLVLGDMGEVGDQGPAFHAEVGEYARQRGVKALLCLGDATRETVRVFGAGAEHFDHVEALITRAREASTADSFVLVKGSRFMKMERVVAALSGNTVTAGTH